MTQSIDYLIVGQGLAGTLMSHFLRANHRQIMVVDDHHRHAASKVAAGIINPITGRRYVKSWKIDDLLPFAKRTYDDLSEQLQTQFYIERRVIRALFNADEEHRWYMRANETAYASYLVHQQTPFAQHQETEPIFAHGEIRQAVQVNLSHLIQSYRNYLLQEGCLLSEKFDHSLLKLEDKWVTYKHIKAKHIIFCEGAGGQINPFFDYLPFNPAKGEVLILDIPAIQTENLLKFKHFLAPVAEGKYWFGATYEWYAKNNMPSPEKYQELLDSANKMLHTPFHIGQHLAAIRPTVKDRRPLLGVHPKYNHLFIFNGLGTKGASLGPYFADQMSNFILHGKALDKEVNIQRFL